jgi:hypothetical protein
MIRFCILDTSPKDAWRAAELTAILQACLGTYFSWKREEEGDCPTKKESTIEYPLLTNRNAQLAAHLQAVMTDSHLLAEALLLSDSDSDSGEMTHLRTYMFYSGSTIHRFLQKSKPEGWKWSQSNQETYELCLAAVVEGIEERVVGWTVGVDVARPLASGEAVEAEGEEEEEVSGGKKRKESPPLPGRVDGDKARKSKSKKKKGKGQNGSGHSQGPAQGRFDLLNSLTE